MTMFYFILNLLTLILLLELIATIYFFFFLSNGELIYQHILKLKNLIMNYLWLSFFTLIFFSLSLLFFIKKGGTLDFIELNILNLEFSQQTILLFFISLF